MKKRVLSVILALCMCISLLPTTARAVEATSYQLYVGSVEVTSSNAENITDDDKVSYDPETNTLTLKNATIEGGEYGIKYNGGNTLNIVGVGNNTVTGNDYGIWATGAGSSLSISGTVTAAASGANTTRGICASNSVTILGDATNVTATSGSGGFDNHGICANYVNIEGGTVSATGELYGIIANMNLAISGGTVTASAPGEFGYALEAAYDITISGGTITADGDDYGIHADRSITISGGTVEMIGGDKAITLHPDLESYEGGCTVIVGQNESDTAEWGSDDLTTYKYVKISAKGEGGGENVPEVYHDGWTNMSIDYALPTFGNWVLTTDVSIDSSRDIELEGDMNLCLNGHTITFPQNIGTRIMVPSGYTLALCDHGQTKGQIDHDSSNVAIGVQGTLTANGVEVAGVATSSNGSAVLTDCTVDGQVTILNNTQVTAERCVLSNGVAMRGNAKLILKGEVTFGTVKKINGISGEYGNIFVQHENGNTATIDATNYTGGNVEIKSDSLAKYKNRVLVTGVNDTTAAKFSLNSDDYSLSRVDSDLYVVENGDTPSAETYTVSFDAGGGSGTMNAVSGVSGFYQLPSCEFTAPAGKQFKAWSVGSEEKEAGAVIAVSADITVTALWEDISYSITGSVTDTSAGTATVKLMQGNTEVKTATVTLYSSDTNYTGTYSFTGVAPGVYNIVVTKGDVTMTVLVPVESADVTVGTIFVPSGSKNSVLDNSQAGDFAATVGGLDKIAANENIQLGQSVEIKLTVKAEEANNADPEQTAIKAQASGKTLEFIDLSLTKKIDNGVAADIGGTNSQLLTIVIPFDTDKQGIMVYRYHDTQATAMTKDPASDKEGFKLGNGSITIYAKKFSTYAIGYTVSSPNPNPNPNPNPQPPVYVPTAHSCVSKCAVCGGCTDADCAEKACTVKCNLLTMDFADVTEALWCYDEVVYVYHNSLMQGYGENEFYPDGTVTRQQVWMILARMSDATPSNMAVARGWAMANGVSDGTNPTAYVTRQQFVAMLWRYAKLQDWDVSVGEDTNILSYNDAFDVAEYAIPAMQWACDSGLMNGKDGNLMPAANTTRGQIAAMFQRFCEDVKK